MSALLANINRVLVIKLRHHGDVLLSSPVFQVLKNHYPHLEIDALIYQDTAAMLLRHPAINQILFIDKNWKQQGNFALLQKEWRLAKQLKARRYDLVIHLTENWRGAWLARLLKPKYAVVRRYPKRRSSWWLHSFSHHYSAPGGNQRHMVEIHLDALRHLGLHPAQPERRLVLVPGLEAEQSLQAKTGVIEQPLIVIHPTSRWFFKCWNANKVAEVADHFANQGYLVALTAAPEAREMEMAERILSAVRLPVMDLAGQLTLKELAALIQQAKLLIGVDSAPMHMASALQTPTVALFGPSGEHEWGPWMNPARIITTQHTCRPCGQDGCGNSKVSDCLMEIETDAVVKAAVELLSDDGGTLRKHAKRMSIEMASIRPMP